MALFCDMENNTVVLYALQHTLFIEQNLALYFSVTHFIFFKFRRIIFIKYGLDLWLNERRKLKVNEKTLKLKVEGEYK